MPQVVAAAFGSWALTATTGATLAASAAAFEAATAIGYAVGTVLPTVLLTGASYLLNRPTGSAASASQLAQAAASIRQATPAQRVVYGTQRIGGAVFFFDDSKPPYLYVGLLLSARRISAFKTITIGNVPCTFGANGEATSTPYFDGTTSYVKCSLRDGDPDQAIDPLLAADFPNLDSSFRQRGIATAVFRFHFGADLDQHQSLWGNVQVPDVEIEVDGAPVYNPREPTQDPDGETTWKFSANASLIIADLLRQPYGGRFTTSEIDWAKIAEAATYDDGLVGLKAGGFQHRYEIGGVASLDTAPLDLATSMLLANRGAIVQDQGKVWVQSAKPAEPTFTIHDKLLAGGFTYQDSPATKSLVNRVRCRFVAPDRQYELADGPVLDRLDLQEADGQLLETTLDLPWVQTHQRAQRLEKATLDDSRKGRTWQGPVRLTHKTLAIKAGDVGRIDSRLFPQMNGIYKVQQSGFSDDFSTVSLTLAEYDSSVEGDWHPETDEQDFTLADLDVS